MKSFKHIILLLLLLVVLNCSDKNPVDNGQKNITIVDLTITPNHAPPGVPINVSGIQLIPAEVGAYRIFIGESETQILTDLTGNIQAVSPIFFDSVLDWHVPPLDPVDVIIYRNDTIIAKTLSAFTSDSLISASGTTSKVMMTLDSTFQSLNEILNSFTLEKGIQQQLLFGLSETIDSFLVSEDIQGILDSLKLSSDELELVDAIIASSGFDNTASEIHEVFKSLALALNMSHNKSTIGNMSRSSIIMNDVLLSQMMQLAAVLDEYANSVVHGISGSLGKLGTGISALNMLDEKFKEFLNKHPLFNKAMDALSIGFTVADLLYSKFIVAGMPTKLDSITIAFNPDANLNLSDTTNSTLTVYASSNPPAVNADDVLGLFLDVVGIYADPKTDRDKYLSKLKSLLGFLKKSLKKYKEQNPTFGYDPDIVDLFSIPKQEFLSIVQDTSLLKLVVNPNDNAVQPLQEILEWRAFDNGTAEVWVETFDSELSPNGLWFGFPFPIPIPIDFPTTTFGSIDSSEVHFSDRHTINISSELFIHLSFPATIQRDSTETLIVTTGHKDGGGAEFGEANLDVVVNTISGLANPAQGFTDALGQFECEITTGATADTITIEVVVTDSLDQQITDTVVAEVLSGQEIGLNIFVECPNGDDNLTNCPVSFGSNSIISILVTDDSDNPVSGVQVEVTVDGGLNTGPIQHTTNSSGYTDFTIQADSTSQAVSLDITASGSGYQTATLSQSLSYSFDGYYIGGSNNNVAYCDGTDISVTGFIDTVECDNDCIYTYNSNRRAEIYDFNPSSNTFSMQFSSGNAHWSRDGSLQFKFDCSINGTSFSGTAFWVRSDTLTNVGLVTGTISDGILEMEWDRSPYCGDFPLHHKFIGRLRKYVKAPL